MIRVALSRLPVAILVALALLAHGVSAPPVAAHGDDLVVETIPVGDPLRPWFRKRVMIFGIEVLATSTVSDVKILHAAAVMAEYLDTDEDSVADQPAVVLAMQQRRATLVMFQDSNQLENSSFWDSEEVETRWVQDNQADETNPVGAFDASLEEVLHLIHTAGYAQVFPDLATESGSALALAMDAARGGYFESVPNNYPPGAWFHYDDPTCEYDCQAAEYFYWGLTSLLGAQTDRCAEIADEWEPCNAGLLFAADSTFYNLLIDPVYGLPMALPDGDYHGTATSVCGNGALEFPEFCDDGAANGGNSSCCEADCRLTPSGPASCDGNICTRDQCSGGVCSTLDCRTDEACSICGGQCTGTTATCDCVF